MEARVKWSRNLFLPVAMILAFAIPGFGSATDIYITQNGSPTGVCASNVQTPAFFNTAGNWGSGAAQIGPGTTVHLCGTFTFPAGTTGFTFQGSGSSGSPITLRFESGAILQAPYFANSLGGTPAGAITLGIGRSWLTVDGANTGKIQNTANGSSLTNAQPSSGVSGFGCTNCTVKNLTIANLYVNVAGNGTLGDNSVVRAIDFNGKNWTISNNIIHDCGWCIFDAYADGDTNANISNNDVSNFGHGMMYAAGSAVTAVAPALLLHDNHFHDTANWGASGCPYHQDGLHTFGVSGSSMDGIYVYNNLFDGDWGTCPTGFIFVEFGGGAGGTPSNMRNSYWFNNVGIVQTGIVNTNGWFGIFSGISGVQKIYNNTILNVNATDNTACFSLQNLSGLTFENNVVGSCGDPVSISSSTITLLNNNFYGPSCQNGNNCFVFNGSFTGSFSAWKSATGGEANSTQSNSPKLNSDGSPQSGSPVIGVGANLLSLASGNLDGLASDTTKGGTRTAVPRASSGAWTAGAYELASGTPAPPPPNAPLPPTGLVGVVH
jgi:hypothetical protein